MEEISIWDILTYIWGKNKCKKRGITYGNKNKQTWRDPNDGIIFINYSNPSGVSEDDPDLTSFLNSLEVNDCFGIVTIDADEINIRDRENTDGNIVGTAKKGEIYKVYAITGSSEYTGEYTWYNIGY